jgi:hypothetical protein
MNISTADWELREQIAEAARYHAPDGEHRLKFLYSVSFRGHVAQSDDTFDLVNQIMAKIKAAETPKPRVTINRVNKALAEAGFEEKLYRGDGYHYFYDGEATTWPTSSVMTMHLNDNTVEEWVEARNRLAGEKD